MPAVERMYLPLFPTDDEVSDLESTLREQGERPAPEILLRLSWALRQREWTRAGLLADQAFVQGLVDPRLDLVRAEALWLQGRLDDAERMAKATLPHFEVGQDALGLGDVLWLLANIERDRGHVISDILNDAEERYVQAGDPLRRRLVQLRRYSDSGPVFVEDAWDRWRAFNADAPYPDVPAAMGWHQFVEASIQGLRGNLADAVASDIRAYDASLATGQIRSAVFCATNASIFFDKLNDLESALEWARNGLDLSRRLASRLLEAQSLGMLGHVLQRLQRFESAQLVLEEGLQNCVPGSGPHRNILTSLGHLALAQGDGDTAYGRFAEVIEAAAGFPLAIASAQADLAQAALMRGRTAEAHAICDALLRQSRDGRNVPVTVELLILKAQILRREREGHALASAGDDAVLSCLREALQLAESTNGMVVAQELLDSLAEESAALGQMEQAYAFAQRARRAAETIRSREANDRAVALQIQHATERLKLEAQHQRELSLREKRRSEELAYANDTLERLGMIGRDITSANGERAVFEAIARHVRELLDAHAIAVFVLDEETETLNLLFGKESDQDLEPQSLSLEDPNRLVSRCARERRELLMNDDSVTAATIEGTDSTRSLMFAPLVLGQRLVGVLTIQSLRRNAYGEREVAIFRSLSAYGAIALVNAQALAALKVAQEHLVEQNLELARLAATDRLTGLPNRRQLDQVLRREIATARRDGTPFSLLILDIDHFKRINDEFGHLVGDQVLEGVGRWLSERVRGRDVPGRWGGEEFLLILPGTDLRGGVQAAQSLRTAFAQRHHAEVGRCTASLGVASYRPNDDVDSLIERADRGLYAAKSGGRNRIGFEADGDSVLSEGMAPEEQK